MSLSRRMLRLTILLLDCLLRAQWCPRKLYLLIQLTGRLNLQSNVPIVLTIFQLGLDSSSLLSMMEQQVRFLSDITFDNLCSSAAASGAAIAARHHVWLRSWKADAAQKVVLNKLPLSGTQVFGQELEDLFKKTVENKKLIAPVSRPASGRGRGWGYKRAFGPGSKVQAQPFRGRGRGPELR